MNVIATTNVWHHGPQLGPPRPPRVLVKGEGVRVCDADGHWAIDGTAGQAVVQIGHGRTEVADAMAAQARALAYAPTAFGYSHPRALELGSRVEELTPGTLRKSFFCSSGSEAVESALKMARQYHAARGDTARHKIVCRQGSYHGVTFGALSASSSPRLRAGNDPLVGGFVRVGQPYPRTCEHCDGGPCTLSCAGEIEQAIVSEGPDTVAAVIAEPVATPDAVKVPPTGYWQRVQETCRRHGVLLIVDEVLNGFGRTGRMFASEHFDIEPDILTLSKGLASGYAPIAAAVAADHVAEALDSPGFGGFRHGGTYSGQPVAAAAALANLEILEREELPQRAGRVGELLRSELGRLTRHAIVAAVDGIGLLLSVRLAAVDGGGPIDPALGRAIESAAYAEGLIVHYLPTSLYLFPPLVLDDAEATEIAAILDVAIERGLEECT